MTASAQTLHLNVALQHAENCLQAGLLQEAERLFRAILQASPTHPEANYHLGMMMAQANQPEAGLSHLKIALAHLKTALEANPDHGRCRLGYIDMLIQAGQIDIARKSLAQGRQRGLAGAEVEALAARLASNRKGAKPKHPGAVKLPPRASPLPSAKQNVQAPENQEIIALAALFNAGRYAELDSRARLLIGQCPDYGPAWKALGASLQMQGKNALAVLQKAAELLPDDAAAHYNFGNTLNDLGKNNEAAASFRRALDIKPDFAEALFNLGNVLKDLGQLDSAVAIYQRTLEIKPDDAKTRNSLLFSYNLLTERSSEEMLAEARRFDELVARQARPHAIWRNTPAPARCLRVGLVSGDLRNHPVGYFLESLLTHMDPARMELIAYPSHRREDELTARIKTCFVAWKPLTGLSDEAAAGLIHADNIDILIDLSGHTANNRLPLFAWKPAPVQASWLGYFATTGVAAMDYFIADPWTAPESEESHFTETIQRLPETYLCFTPPDMDVPVASLPALANGHITFGCFNNLTKMNDTVVALWARVLLATPGSRLFLKTKQLGEVSVRQSTMARFAAHGIDADRLILEGAAPRAELLASYRRVDIALDPFPYPGGATSAEALWMGVPVLTLAGKRFLSHIGESILQNAGLPEWIATDADDYVARVASHAAGLQRLAMLRDGLRQQVLASPIFDAPRFAHHFEAALRDMWRKWCEFQA